MFLDAACWCMFRIKKNVFDAAARIRKFNWISKSVSYKWHNCTLKHLWHFPNLMPYFHSKMCLWKFNPLSAWGELWSGAWSLNIWHDWVFTVLLNRAPHWTNLTGVQISWQKWFIVFILAVGSIAAGTTLTRHALYASDASPEWLILVLSRNEYCCCFHCPNDGVLCCSLRNNEQCVDLFIGWI